MEYFMNLLVPTHEYEVTSSFSWDLLFFEGKRMVEARTRQLYSDEKHLILRPGVVHTGVLQR